VELYDIAADVYEKHDLKEGHPEVVKALRKKLRAWQMSLPEKPPARCFSKLRTQRRK